MKSLFMILQNRIEKLEEDWKDLLTKSREKGSKLKEANQQQDFVMAVKDLELWMTEVLQFIDFTYWKIQL